MVCCVKNPGAAMAWGMKKTLVREGVRFADALTFVQQAPGKQHARRKCWADNQWLWTHPASESEPSSMLVGFLDTGEVHIKYLPEAYVPYSDALMAQDWSLWLFDDDDIPADSGFAFALRALCDGKRVRRRAWPQGITLHVGMGDDGGRSIIADRDILTYDNEGGQRPWTGYPHELLAGDWEEVTAA